MRSCVECGLTYRTLVPRCGLDGAEIVQCDQDLLIGRSIDRYTILERLGYRVALAENGDVTSSQAFLRWLASVGFAPILLGFLWVIWSREKRAWHDIIAQTWVIRQ